VGAFSILQLIQVATGAVTGSCAVYQMVKSYLESLREHPSRQVLAFLNDLGCQTDREIRRLVDAWNPPTPVTDEQREELANLLINLAHGARGHSTRGTLGSGFAQCAELIDQLIREMQTVRRRGQPVHGGLADWRLERFLGKGSFGEVWLGRNPGHPEPRAFKFFTQPNAGQWLLAREQQTLYQIRSKLNEQPNIVEFLDVITRGTRYPFIVLEYVAGGSLEEWILSKPADRATLQKQEVIEGVIRGLSVAHAERIYHRDLKPANVLLTEAPDVQAKIADFGLGQTEADAAATSLSAQSFLVGTNMYLPPEATEPFVPREPGKDDVFALGVLWYQFVVERLERPPYDFAEQLQAAGADSHTVRLIARCLANPQRRFPDACAVETAFVELPPEPWNAPKDCIDVGPLAREYLASLSR
jgi:serine/threonine protein kinase